MKFSLVAYRDHGVFERMTVDMVPGWWEKWLLGSEPRRETFIGRDGSWYRESDVRTCRGPTNLALDEVRDQALFIHMVGRELRRWKTNSGP